MATIVVSDTSPLRALHYLGLVSVLPTLFDTILIPPAVHMELKAVFDIQELDTLLGQSHTEFRNPRDQALIDSLRQSLDRGESEALALAVEIRADIVLIDEHRGRRVAETMGLEPIGVLGLLLIAKSRGLISTIAPSIEKLRTQHRFFLSPRLILETLRKAGETA